MDSGRKTFKNYNKLIKFLVLLNSINPDKLNLFFFNLIRNLQGKIGLLCRYVIAKNLLKNCGDNVSIHQGVFLKNLKKLSLGNNVSIHPMCYIDASGAIDIGDNVSIAHSSTIMSTTHTWDNKTLPIKYNKIINKAVIIENDVWIGCGCRILAGISISKRVIIAAGAVVVKNVKSNSIYGGVPAKFIKTI